MAYHSDPRQEPKSAQVVRLPVALAPAARRRAAGLAYAAAPFLAQLIHAGLARRGLAMPGNEADAARLAYRRPPPPPPRRPGARIDRKV